MSDIVKNARTALLLMNERGLAPTPDNYSKIYNEVSGITDDHAAQAESHNAKEIIENNRRLTRYLDELTASISANTGDLAEKLEKQGSTIRQLITELHQTGDELHISALFQPILVLIDSVHQSVKDSHKELVNTRESLQEVRSELSQTKQQMLIDPLTGARNRLNMEYTIKQERSRAKRNHTKLTVVMADIDHFKQLNDTFGHDVGDKVLAYFAEVVRSIMRDIDTLFRYGGEEFLLLMPETDRFSATQVTERLREALTKKPPVNPKDKSKLPITFSAGVAELTLDDDAQSLITRADKVLYLAKQQGRDRTMTDLQLDGNLETQTESPEASMAIHQETKAPKTKSGFQMPVDDETIYLGRLPILQKDHTLFGYDLSLYPSQLVREQPKIQINDVVNYLSNVGLEYITHEHIGFIPVDHDGLMGTDLKRLAGDRLVLEITDVSVIDQKALAQCLELKERGFKLSLADYFAHPVYDVVLKLFDYVKLDIHATSPTELNSAISRLNEFSYIQRIAKNVGTLGMLERCMEMGFHLVQGNFFTHTEASTLGKANHEQTTLLVVLGQLLTDVDLPRIERTFQGHEELTINLLALVNSAAMGLSRKVGSLQQALVILGRRQLMRWVQVLLYSHSDIKSASVLMQMAAVRAKLMDLLCSTHADADKRLETYRDRAFTIGILSLTHVLLGMDLVQVVEQIGLDDETRSGLMNREGFLGHLLSLVEHVETANFVVAETLLKELRIEPRSLNKAQIETLEWVHNLGKTTD